jgi:hypothetical protein
MSTYIAEPEVLVTRSSEHDDGLRGPRHRDEARIGALRPQSPTPTYIGVGVAALGFVLLAIAWVQVAQETDVALQMPYLVSGGLAGVCCVFVGLTIVSIAARRRDAALRERQTALIAAALANLHSLLGGRDGRT